MLRLDRAVSGGDEVAGVIDSLKVVARQRAALLNPHATGPQHRAHAGRVIPFDCAGVFAGWCAQDREADSVVFHD